MNKRIKKLWVAALRSGEYMQGPDRIRSEDNKFCCLGVLCNLHAQAFPKIAAKETEATIYMGWSGWAAPEVENWAGLRRLPSFVTINGRRMNLGQHNDNGATFAQIADAIEAQL